MIKILRINRSQLAKFLDDHETIKEFEQLFINDSELVVLVENIIEAVGLSEIGEYIQRDDSNYLDASETIYQDSTILDTELFDGIRDYVINVATSTSLSASNQLVLCDAISGVMNITLPSPTLCFSDNRSFKIAIHKIDVSANQVNILPFGSELVVGEASQSLLKDGEIYNFITDGTNWYLGA